MAQPIIDRQPCCRCGRLKTLRELWAIIDGDEMERLGLVCPEQASDEGAAVMQMLCEPCLVAKGGDPTDPNAEEMAKEMKEWEKSQERIQ